MYLLHTRRDASLHVPARPQALTSPLRTAYRTVSYWATLCAPFGRWYGISEVLYRPTQAPAATCTLCLARVRVAEADAYTYGELWVEAREKARLAFLPGSRYAAVEWLRSLYTVGELRQLAVDADVLRSQQRSGVGEANWGILSEVFEEAAL